MNKIIKLHGQQHYFLAGKPTDTPNISIYLSRILDDKQGYYLWNIEDLGDDDNITIWPYEGVDRVKLKLELQKYFVEHAFDKIDEN